MQRVLKADQWVPLENYIHVLSLKKEQPVLYGYQAISKVKLNNDMIKWDILKVRKGIPHTQTGAQNIC
jgi:hypothetical protein